MKCNDKHLTTPPDSSDIKSFIHMVVIRIFLQIPYKPGLTLRICTAVGNNDWQLSIYWVHQWSRHWQPGMASFLPVTDYHQMATVFWPGTQG